MNRYRSLWLGGTVSVALLVTGGPAWRGTSIDASSLNAADAGQAKPARTAGRPVSPRPLGGDIAPDTTVWDPYPTFNGVAIDTENNRVVFSDLNRHTVLTYDRLANSTSGEPVDPVSHVMGPATEMGFVAGVAVDPEKRELYVAENDAWGVRVFSYDDQGNVAPRRLLATPHQAWGLSLSRPRKELAVSVEELNAVVVYRQGAEKLEPPLRTLRGDKTKLADPHGVSLDATHNELAVANHGSWTTYTPNSNHDELEAEIPVSSGRFEKPSIRIYAADAQGDAAPIRSIQGERTGLDWPMQIEIDAAHDEIAVANFGHDEIAIFRRQDHGDVAPIRTIRGTHTGLVGPVGVAVDTKNDEIWVANYGDHTALVFPRGASGDVAPKRVIRNAPQGAATCGFTDASSTAYDSKRKEVLVAN